MQVDVAWMDKVSFDKDEALSLKWQAVERKEACAEM